MACCCESQPNVSEHNKPKCQMRIIYVLICYICYIYFTSVKQIFLFWQDMAFFPVQKNPFPATSSSKAFPVPIDLPPQPYLKTGQKLSLCLSLPLSVTSSVRLSVFSVFCICLFILCFCTCCPCDLLCLIILEHAIHCM